MILASTAFSQYVLTYKDNALLKGDAILSKDVQFVDPGSPGLNQIWDFSRIITKGTENSNSILPVPAEKREGLGEYNILLKDSGHDYYMYLTATNLTEKGYTSKDFTMVYSDPLLKMVYPFAYGDSFTDKYAGSAAYMGTSKVEISGDNTVSADALGTLILPGLTLTNTLRVKAEKAGLEVNTCSTNVLRFLKYSWYAPGYRYPVLVISTTEIRTNGTEPVITKSAVLNVQQAENTVTLTGITEPQPQPANDNAVSVYPNPFNDNFNFHYFLPNPVPVKIVLYDVTGKFARVIQQSEILAEGIHTGKVDAGKLGLTPGMYYLKFTFDNKAVVKKLVKL